MMKQPLHKSTTRGFARAATLLQSQIRKASEGRGFAETRLLTHWSEIVGTETAKSTRPASISYAQGGMGATLTLLATGAMAPIVEMKKEQIRDKVNACYGYRAISRIRVTQTAPTGFSEGRMSFSPAPKEIEVTDPQAQSAARDLALDCKNDALRAALETLGTQVLTKHKS